MKFSLKLALVWRDSKDVIDFAYRAKITLDKAGKYNAFFSKKTGRAALPFSALTRS